MGMGDPSAFRHAVVKAGDIVEGRYRIGDVLGEGGSGTVFLAEHVLIKRRVALKVLHPDLATDAEVVQRFMNEARAAGTLGHPNIVESTDMGFTRDNIPYIVFEYLEGSLLTDEIYRIRGLPMRRAIRIAYQIASALEAAHNAGIVHRDLKSDNVFLTDREDVSDHVKVLDFGISRFAELEKDSSRPRPNWVMGTPEFMAPEQITAPDRVDRRADVYALGVILYEMLAGRYPFRADHDPHAVLHQVVHDPPPPLKVPNLVPGLQEMIFTKLLVKEPDRRYQSMKDVQAALEAFHLVTRPADSMTPLSVPIPRMTPTDLPTPVPSGEIEVRPSAQVRLDERRGRGLGWLLAALVAGAGGAALYALQAQEGGGIDPNALGAVRTAADKLATQLDGEAKAAHLRASGIAQTPMLRAAIETDAATLKDMVGSDFIFTPKEGEVVEVFQLRDKQAVSLLRIPETAPALEPLERGQTRIAATGDDLAVLVSEPVLRQDGSLGGIVVVSGRMSLQPVKQAFAAHAGQATLLGLAAPITLARGDGAGSPTTIPVAAGDLKLSVSATVPQTRSDAEQLYRIPSFAALGMSGALFLMFLVTLLRGRGRG